MRAESPRANGGRASSRAVRAESPAAVRFAALAASLVLVAACTSEKKPGALPPPPPPPAPEVVLAEQFLEQGRLQDATIAAVDIARKNPQAAGLADLQHRIAQRLAEERMAAAVKRSAPAANLSTADAKHFGVMPDMYRTKKHVVGETSSLRTGPTPMQEMLTNSVSINLSDADLNAIILQIGQTAGINMIADSALREEEAAVSIFVENAPLIEVLEYIGRNLNVSFFVGDNLIWVTSKPEDDPPPGPPLETRIYRLRKGMIGDELGKSVSGITPFSGVTSSSGGGNQQQQQQQQQQDQEAAVGLIEAIDTFVPQPEGAAYLFNDKAHVLIVKNTRENLATVEDFIEELDVRPRQVLIEARFIQTTVSDLRDLGIEWLLDHRKYPRLADETAISGPDVMANTMKFTRRALTAASDPTGGALAWQFVLGDTALEAVLHALHETGNTKTIVVPRVTVLNNKEASFRVGEDTTYFDDVTTQISSTTGYGNNNSRDSTFNYNRPSTVETGYSLVVTPSVGADLSAINLVLRPEISKIKEWRKYTISTTTFQDPNDPNGTPQAPAIEIPTLSRQYIETEVVIRSGETIVLGGLVNTLQQEDVKGVPWFHRIPLLGYLFKTEKKQETYENILIFVTATVLSDVGEELIPLQAFERYGLEVPADLTIPDVLRTPPPAEEGEGEGGGEGDGGDGGGGDGDAPDAAPDAGAAAPLPDAVPLEAAAPAAPVAAPEAAAAAADVLAELLPDPDVPIPVLVPPVPDVAPVAPAVPVPDVAPVAPAVPAVPVPAVVPVAPAAPVPVDVVVPVAPVVPVPIPVRVVPADGQ